MTDRSTEPGKAQQPQAHPNPKDAFIITREEMKWIREGSQMDVLDVLEDVFKRPHTSASHQRQETMTPPQQPKEDYTDDVCEWCGQRHPLRAKERFYQVLLFGENLHTICGDCYDHLKLSYPEFPDSSRPHPATVDPAGDCDTCRFVKECSPLYLPPCYNGSAIRAARQAREELLETLEDLRKWSNGEYNEAYLSDNEREMRIHNDYGCKIWGVMQSLRQQVGDHHE